MQSPALTITRNRVPADIARLGAALRAGWLVAEICGPAQVLGRWERRRGDANAVRRRAGGATVSAQHLMILVVCALQPGDPAALEQAVSRHVRSVRSVLQKIAWPGEVFWGVAEGGISGILEMLLPADQAGDRFTELAGALGEEVGAEPRALTGDVGAGPRNDDGDDADDGTDDGEHEDDDEAGFVDSGVNAGLEALVRHDGARIIAARLHGPVQGALGELAARLAGVALAPDAVADVLGPSPFADLVVHTREVALAALAEKYAVLAALRGRREAAIGEFDSEELAARGAAFRAIAARHPGALRELEAHTAAALAARARAVEHARALGAPVGTPWIRAVLDFHQTLAAVLAARRRSRGARRPRVLDVVFDEVATRQGAAPADVEELVFGAARRPRDRFSSS